MSYHNTSMFIFSQLPESVIIMIMSYLKRPPTPHHIFPIRSILCGLDDMVDYIEGKRIEFDNTIRSMIINPCKIDLFMIKYEPTIKTKNSRRGLYCLWIKNIIETKLSIKDMNTLHYLFTNDSVEMNVYNELISSVTWKYSIR